MHRPEGARERALNQGENPSRASDQAARRIEEAADDDSWDEVEELLGDTDCPNGCHVEPDGRCPHGWESAALTAGLI